MNEMKKIPVTIEDKINLVKWCSKNFKSPSRAVHWFFNSLLNNTKYLDRVKFVEDNRSTFRQVTIKSADASTYGSPFIYTRDGNPYGTSEKCMNDIFNEAGAYFYIQLEFKDKFQTPEFVAVLEENPYIKTNETVTSAEALKYIDETLIKVRVDYEKEEIARLIDKALDDRDEEAFMKLTSNTIL